MFKNLLVAIDSSDAAIAAAATATELARQLHARLTLVHVLNPATYITSPELVQVYQPALDEMKPAGETLLREAKRRIDDGTLDIETQLLIGDPAILILRAAEEHDADLIVVGTDARGRLAHFLLGSTADAIISRAPCPVLAVRNDTAAAKHQTEHPQAERHQTEHARNEHSVEQT